MYTWSRACRLLLLGFRGLGRRRAAKTGNDEGNGGDEEQNNDRRCQPQASNSGTILGQGYLDLGLEKGNDYLVQRLGRLFGDSGFEAERVHHRLRQSSLFAEMSFARFHLGTGLLRDIG
jgi:hypothetical protein